jgi:hypothetical protein
MRTLLIKRMIELRELNKNFPEDTMRWRNFTFDGIHISKIKFTFKYLVKYTDEELIGLFERIVKRYYQQM